MNIEYSFLSKTPGEIQEMILNRLAIVGDSGMGALSYRPAIPLHEEV